MNYNQLMEIIKDSEVSVDDFAYDNVPNDIREKIGKWSVVDKYGGEGQGEIWYSVKYFPEHDIYIKVSGFYQSYNGTEFDGFDLACKEVKPVEKKVTVYESL